MIINTTDAGEQSRIVLKNMTEESAREIRETLVDAGVREEAIQRE